MFNFLENNNITYNFVKGINGKFLRVIYEQIFMLIKFCNYNIIYFLNNINLIFLGAKCKLIITIYDLLLFRKANRFGFLQRLYLKFFTYMCAYKLEKIATVFNNLKNDIINTFNVKSDKVIVTYNILGDFKKFFIH